MRRRARFSPAAAFIDASRKPVLKTGLVLLLPGLSQGGRAQELLPVCKGRQGRLVPFPSKPSACAQEGQGAWQAAAPDGGSGWKRPLPQDAEGTPCKESSPPHVSPPPL